MLLRNLFTKFSPSAPRVSNIHKYTYALVDISKCFYCLAPAKAFDHVLPQSLAKLLPYFNFPSELLKLVPCCTKCNSIAGNRFFITLAAKKKFILTRINELKVRSTYAEVIDRLERLLAK
jgi:5-methylcytosine-specific restriction endonuclease McrA